MENLEGFSRSSLERLDQPSIMQLAKEGHFRSVAYWLNVYLVPQGIYACVSSAPQPGYLLVLLEFQRVPDRDRLNRFICYRLCQLRSDVVQGVRIVTRLMGAPTLLWDQSVRLVSPARRQRRSIPISQIRQSLSSDLNRTTQAVHLYLKQLQLQDYLKHPQAQLMLKSALTAFVLGCGVEVVHQTALSFFAPSETAIARPDVVATALETIKVTPLTATTAHDPTVTLTFSGDGALNTAIAPRPNTPIVKDQASLPVAAGDRSVDVAFANLDTPLRSASEDQTEAAATEDTSETLQALKSSGTTVVSLANNQMVGEDGAGLTQTISALEQAGIHPIGAGRNVVEARRPEILDVKGQRIAYLAYSDSDRNAAGAWKAGLNPGLDDQVAADIQAIRDQVDWVVVNYHWNRDLEPTVADWQKHLAHFAIDQGADLVVGHHPSVLQGAEVYQGRAIAYSLGNFIFNDGSSNAQDDYDTAVLKVSLRQGQMKLEFVPVEVKQAKPQIVGGGKAADILQHIRQASTAFEQPLTSPMTLKVRSQTASIPAILPETITSPEPAIPSEAATPSPEATTPSPEATTQPVKTAPIVAPPSPSESPVKASSTPNASVSPDEGSASSPGLSASPESSSPESSSPESSSPESSSPDTSNSFITKPEALPSEYEGIKLNGPNSPAAESPEPSPNLSSEPSPDLKLDKENSRQSSDVTPFLKPSNSSSESQDSPSAEPTPTVSESAPSSAADPLPEATPTVSESAPSAAVEPSPASSSDAIPEPILR